MSAGHKHQESAAVSSAKIEELRRDPQVMSKLYRATTEDNSWDIPFIAGYSTDGKTIYFDRNLPKELTIEHDGRKRTFDPRSFYRVHETWEKALIDALGYTYFPAHRVATAMEKRAVLERLGPMWWMPYTEAADGLAKTDEHERIRRCPRDLDLTPYEATPVDRRLLAAVKRAM